MSIPPSTTSTPEGATAVSQREKASGDRVLQKAATAIEAGHYYEAHQMYRTLYFRFTKQKRFAECTDTLIGAAKVFLEHDQRTIANDLACLLLETLATHPPSDQQAITGYITSLAGLFEAIGPSVVDRDKFRSLLTSWARARSPAHGEQAFGLLARIFWTEGNMEAARNHYMRTAGGPDCATLLVQLSQERGMPSECDLFIAQTCLQLIVLRKVAFAAETLQLYAQYHPLVACAQAPYPMPVLNALHFVLQCCERATSKGASVWPSCLAAYQTVCELYGPALFRDPDLQALTQRIAEMYFGAAPQQRAGNIFAQMLDGLFSGAGESDVTNDVGMLEHGANLAVDLD